MINMNFDKIFVIFVKHCQDCNITCGEEALDETSESVKTSVNNAVVAKYEWVLF